MEGEAKSGHPHMRIAHDDVVISVNWESRSDRRLTPLQCSVSADIDTGYVFSHRCELRHHGRPSSGSSGKLPGRSTDAHQCSASLCTEIRAQFYHSINAFPKTNGALGRSRTVCQCGKPLACLQSKARQGICSARAYPASTGCSG